MTDIDPMEPKGAEFARCEKNRIYFGSDGFYIEYYIDGNTQEFLRGVNAAHRRAVEEAVKKAHREWADKIPVYGLESMADIVKEAESRVWEAAAKIAEGERVEEIGPGDDAYNTAVKHIAEALRAKAASS